jgi:hypothetical protein
LKGLFIATTVTCFHGWIPAVRQSVYMFTRALGCAAWAHLSNLYPTPLGPSAEAFVVDWRACLTSVGVTSAHWWVTLGGGLSGWQAKMVRGLTGKKRAQRRSSFSCGFSARELSSCQSAGKMLLIWPFRTLAICHILAALSTLLSRSFAQVCFAFFIVWRNLQKAWRHVSPVRA